MSDYVRIASIPRPCKGCGASEAQQHIDDCPSVLAALNAQTPASDATRPPDATETPDARVGTSEGRTEPQSDARGMDNQGEELDRLRAKVERVEALAERMAGALGIALYDAHPAYGSTAGWRGGIGGAAITQSCSLIDPPPADQWMDAALDLLSTPLREYLLDHPEFDLNAAKAHVAAVARAALDGTE